MLERLKSKWPLSLLIAFLLLLTPVIAFVWLLRSSGASSPSVTVTITPRLYREGTLGMVPIEKHPTSLGGDVKTLFYEDNSQTFPANHASGLLVFANQTEKDVVLEGGGNIELGNGIRLEFGPCSIPAHTLNAYVAAYADISGEVGALPAFDFQDESVGGITGFSVENLAFSLDPTTISQETLAVQNDLEYGPPSKQFVQELLTTLHEQDARDRLWANPRTDQCTASSQRIRQTVLALEATVLRITFHCTEETYMDAPGPPTVLPLSSYFSVAVLTAYTPSQTSNPSDLGAKLQTVWIIRINTQQLVHLLAGCSQARARQILLAQAGIAEASFSARNRLPPDPKDIHLQVGGGGL